MHTYTVHLDITAESDRMAVGVATYIQDLLEDESIKIRGMYLTDTDDWAEHVSLDPTVVQLCNLCSQNPVADRCRAGIGKRVCSDCALKNPIKDEF